MKKKLLFYGVIIGLINSVFGAGGGMVCVPLLKSLGLEQKKAQATTVCIILPLTVITSAIYLLKGYVTFKDALPYILPGFAGAIAGSTLLKKLSNNLLKNIFAVFMLWAGIRLVMR